MAYACVDVDRGAVRYPLDRSAKHNRRGALSPYSYYDLGCSVNR